MDDNENSVKKPDGAAGLALPPELLDWRLFTIVSAILVVLIALFVIGVWTQWRSYETAINSAIANKITDNAAVLSYNRALGAAMMKTSALFLGYLLVFTGALYVLRRASGTYRLRVKAEGYEGTLQASSPGLVIITLGVVLISITILTRSDINYVAPTVETVPTETQVPAGENLEQIQPQANPPTTTPPSERK